MTAKELWRDVLGFIAREIDAADVVGNHQEGDRLRKLMTDLARHVSR